MAFTKPRVENVILHLIYNKFQMQYIPPVILESFIPYYLVKIITKNGTEGTEDKPIE